jgi:uncharacterized membrane protein YhdT
MSAFDPLRTLALRLELGCGLPSCRRAGRIGTHRENERMSADTKARLVGLAMAVLLWPTWLLFARFSNETRGFVVFCVSGVAYAAAYVQRKKRNRMQLWLLIAIIYLVELPLALLVPLPSRVPGSAMLPVSFANLFLVLGAVSLFQRLRNDPDAMA